ncbi:heme ABC exporter ATP-binding protein CcmA [Inhella gelatinilytica]|uniref:Heme ABC exporter ATP-binding protein CcmA n=1 Tax=Inhella gelatinilytica TaxID=2795030 RepID=A0A931IXY3_9BURK|nr:heme ABC exporter ATP-binding protein CcmA [Inhella gelatinilytica]MBH9552053.1 heme ABC exporter ATP-binding protein CcmA [Inhella gelatinilytica]
MLEPTPVALVLRGLRCQRGGRVLFPAQDRSLTTGSAVWLRGTNGSGKTTLLRVLAGLGQAAQGTFECRLPRLYLGHANGLKEDLTVGESLRWASALAGLTPAPAAIEGALSAFGLRRLQHRPVRTLSQGQRRRTALARLALPSPRPALWLLDEPFDALDTEGVAALVTCMREHCAQGGAVLYTSHLVVPNLPSAPWDLQALAGGAP